MNLHINISMGYLENVMLYTGPLASLIEYIRDNDVRKFAMNDLGVIRPELAPLLTTPFENVKEAKVVFVLGDDQFMAKALMSENQQVTLVLSGFVAFTQIKEIYTCLESLFPEGEGKQIYQRLFDMIPTKITGSITFEYNSATIQGEATVHEEGVIVDMKIYADKIQSPNAVSDWTEYAEEVRHSFIDMIESTYA